MFMITCVPLLWICVQIKFLQSVGFPTSWYVWARWPSHRCCLVAGSQPYLILPLGQWNGEETPHSNTPNIWSRSHKWAGREFWQVSEVVWSASLRLCLPGKKGKAWVQAVRLLVVPALLGPPPLITRLNSPSGHLSWGACFSKLGICLVPPASWHTHITTTLHTHDSAHQNPGWK